MKPLITQRITSSNSYVADIAYEEALDKRLRTLASGPDATLESVICGARGAFPTLVIERLRDLGLYQNLSNEPEMGRTVEASFTGPDLHPLDFEWYFTTKCAGDLARTLSNDSGYVLCLGSPTVAVAVARLGQKALLVDRNPLIRNRLARGLTSLQFILSDLLNPLPLKRCFPAVFFDAPWYPEFTMRWLWQAMQVVRQGGIVAFALFPPCLRPEAAHERSQILKQVSSFGQVKIQKEALSYETPLFEREALARCGVRITTSWRRADLVLIRVNEIPQEYPPICYNHEERWDSFILGHQVVKLRRHTHGEGFILAPLEDCSDYVFPSVSRRDPRRNQIDLWTSRNRVARVGQRYIVFTILDLLARGTDINQLKESPILSSISLTDREQLISSFRLIIEFSLEGGQNATYNNS